MRELWAKKAVEKAGSGAGFDTQGRGGDCGGCEVRRPRVQARVRKLLKWRSKGPLHNVRRACLVCGQPFTSRQPRALYCKNPECRRRAYYQLVDHGIPPGTMAVLSQLRVEADLLEKGYEVFPSLSLNCSCSLMIFKQGRSFRIEVRTGRENPKAQFIFSRQRLDQVDVVAVVLPKRIVYLWRDQVQTGKSWWPATLPPTTKAPI